MRKVVRLTESDLVRIVKRVIRESEDEVYDDNDDLIGHYSLDKDRLDTARFIPNQKGTEKGHSMGANTPERSYKKPGRDSGMERLMAKDDFARLRPERIKPERMRDRSDEIDLNEDEESSNKKFQSSLWKKYDFLPHPDETPRKITSRELIQMERFDREVAQIENTLNELSLPNIIKLLGGKDMLSSFLRRYEPLGIKSLNDLIEFKTSF